MLPLFATPWAFAALLAVPTLAALYWLRNSYRQLPVSSLMLWLDLVESKASGLRVKRLKTPLLFFLELAALALLALAATGPRMEIGPDRRPVVVVLDDSFSMAAGGEASPRLLGAKALEGEFSWGGVVRFVLAGTSPQALGDPVNSWTEARDLLAAWRCRSTDAAMPEALALARELGGDQARILVVTDHAPGRDLEPGKLLWRAFGAPRPNHAILRVGRASRDGVDRCTLGLANFSDRFSELVLAVESLRPGQEVHRERIPLAPREARQVSFLIKGDAGPVRLRLLADDAMSNDNEAYLATEDTPPIRVELKVNDETLRDLFDKALQATGRTLPPGKRPHLLVSDDTELPIADPETWVVHVLAEKDADAYLGPFVLERTHPLTEGLSLGGVVWGAGKPGTFPGAPVILAGNTPLVTDAESLSGQHRLRIRLRPDLSTLTQSPAWPILIWNLVHWRGQELPGLDRVNLRLGDSALFSARSAGEPVIVTGPGEETRSLPMRGSRVVIPAEAEGVYTVRHAGDTSAFTVSSLSADESDLKNAVTGQWGEWTEDGVSTPGVFHFAWLLLLMALAVLIAHLILASRA